MNIQSGVVNHAPVAVLKVTPDFGGAPAQVTLDASGSYDIDGSIAAYRWDFDADGTWDWLSTDPLPEQSSDGTVLDITLGATPGSVTANYVQGSAEWLYPRITVLDDVGEETTATARLGISGWTREVISSDTVLFDPPGNEISFIVQDMDVDPVTGEVVACGYVYYKYVDMPRAIRFARRSAVGVWSDEEVMPSVGSLLEELNARPQNMQIGWQADGEPLILFTAEHNQALERYDARIALAERSSSGIWNASIVVAGELPLTSSFRGAVNAKLIQRNLGHFACMFCDVTTGVNHDGNPAGRYYTIYYDNGTITLEDTGWVSNNTTPASFPIGLAFDLGGHPSLLLPSNALEQALMVQQLEPASPGPWAITTLFSLPTQEVMAVPVDQTFDEQDARRVLLMTFPDYPSDVYNNKLIILNASNPDGYSELRRGVWCVNEIYSSLRGSSAFSYSDLNVDPERFGAFHDLAQPDGEVVHEEIYGFTRTELTAHDGGLVEASVCALGGGMYSILSWSGGEDYRYSSGGGTDTAGVQLFCTRVDPRPLP